MLSFRTLAEHDSKRPLGARARSLIVVATAAGLVSQFLGARPALASAVHWSPPLPQHADTVVKKAAAPRHPGVARLVEEIAIGGANATQDEYLFSSISDVLPLRDGSVLVLDNALAGTAALRQYDANGKYLRTFGRHGQGPGEYASPSGLAQFSDGRIALRDLGNGRIDIYSLTGESVATWRADNNRSFLFGQDMLFADSAGMLYERVPLHRTQPGELPQYGIRRFRAGEVVDTLIPPPLPMLPPSILSATVFNTNGSPSGTSRVPIPFVPSAEWAWSPRGYFVTGVTSQYAFELNIPAPSRGALGARQGAGAAAAGAAPVSTGAMLPVWHPGDPVVSIRRDVAPVPVSSEERAERRAALEWYLRSKVPDWKWTGPDIPRTKPPYKSLQVGLDGRIWVNVAVPSERYEPPPSSAPATTPPKPVVHWRDATMFDVFEPDGTYLGQVDVPYPILARRGDIVWCVIIDADGVQTVKRFRIAWK
jgi:hypothetical protein